MMTIRLSDQNVFNKNLSEVVVITHKSRPASFNYGAGFFYEYTIPQRIQVLSTLLIGKHQIPDGASGRFYQHTHYQQAF